MFRAKAPQNVAIPLESDFFQPEFSNRDFLATNRESLAIAALIKKYQPNRFLEFGVYKGHILELLMANDYKGEYLGIDINKFTPKTTPDFKFKFIWKSSLDLKPSDLGEEGLLFDLILIDGAHDYHNVKNDTELAMKVLSPGGIILWDDYKPSTNGVFKYINELKSHKEIFQVEDTSLVIYKG